METDGQTDGPTDMLNCRDAIASKKKTFVKEYKHKQGTRKTFACLPYGKHCAFALFNVNECSSKMHIIGIGGIFEMDCYVLCISYCNL